MSIYVWIDTLFMSLLMSCSHVFLKEGLRKTLMLRVGLAMQSVTKSSGYVCRYPGSRFTKP